MGGALLSLAYQRLAQMDSEGPGRVLAVGPSDGCVLPPVGFRGYTKLGMCFAFGGEGPCLDRRFVSEVRRLEVLELAQPIEMLESDAVDMSQLSGNSGGWA